MNCRIWGGVATLAFALSPLAPLKVLPAQEYEHRAELQNCVSTYFDASFYGWLAIRNNCGAPITVTFVGANGTNNGTVTLAAGAHKSTGHSRADWSTAGGIYYAVCNADHYPVETNRGVWTHADQPFICNQR